MTARELRYISRAALMMAVIVLSQTLPLLATSSGDYAYLETWPYTWFQAVGAWVTSWFGGTVDLP